MTKLARTTYKPNFSDPRVAAKVCKVLAWCELMISDSRPTPVHSKVLVEIFGSSANKLATYLRANLLIQSGTYAAGVKSFEYSISKPGLAKIKALLQQAPPRSAPYNVEHIFSNPLETKHKDELNNLTFTYREKSDRYWHPLQNIKREQKHAFWQSRLPFSYDIVACAPTILLGLATNLGLNQLVGKPIRDYLSNKAQLRGRLAALLDIPPQDAKRIINSLFNGAKISTSPYCTHGRFLGKKKIALLQADPEVRALRQAIKSMWRNIDQHIDRDVKTSKGKWALYFRWERIILDIIVRELRAQGIKHFTEHDGFRTNLAVDTTNLAVTIKSITNLDVTIEMSNAGEQCERTTPSIC